MMAPASHEHAHPFLRSLRRALVEDARADVPATAPACAGRAAERAGPSANRPRRLPRDSLGLMTRVSRSHAPDEGRLTPADRQALETRRAWALGFRPTRDGGWVPPPGEGWRKQGGGRSWIKDESTDRSVR